MSFSEAKEPMIPKEFIWPSPNSSFHPLFEGLQHTISPYRTFHPVPFSGLDFSRLLSPYLRHSRRGYFVWHVHPVSTFLHPFAPRTLLRFSALTDALTPARSASHRPQSEQVSLVHIARPSMHSVTKHLTRPVIAFLLPAQRGRLPGTTPTVLPGPFPSLDFPLNPKGRRIRTAESCSSLSYGLHVHLGLLSTPSHDGAVTFSYRERASPGRGLSPLRSRLLPGARIPAFAGMTNQGSGKRRKGLS
jgi:hypothetical protein